MRRFAACLLLVVVCSGSMQAQDIRTLTEAVTKMQSQMATLSDQLLKAQSTIAQQNTRIATLDAEVNELQERLKLVTASGGSYQLNAGTGSLTIRAGTLVFESTGPTHLKGGSMTVTSNGTLAVSTSGGTAFTTQSLDLNVLSNASLTSGSTFNLSAGGASTFSIGSAFTIQAAGDAKVTANGGLLLKGQTALGLETGSTFLLKGSQGTVETNDALTMRSRTMKVAGTNSLGLESPMGSWLVSGTLNLRGSTVSIKTAVINPP
jgi:hypothetical protein